MKNDYQSRYVKYWHIFYKTEKDIEINFTKSNEMFYSFWITIRK